MPRVYRVLHFGDTAACDAPLPRLRKPRGALPPILDGDSPASALIRGKTSFGAGCLLGPSRPLRFRHLTNHELPRRNLLAHEFELRLPRVVISFPARLRHYRSLPSRHLLHRRQKAALAGVSTADHYFSLAAMRAIG